MSFLGFVGVFCLFFWCLWGFLLDWLGLFFCWFLFGGFFVCFLFGGWIGFGGFLFVLTVLGGFLGCVC